MNGLEKVTPERSDLESDLNDRTKVLFLNPPGKEIYIRDYYCSKVSKAYYLPQPVDLLVQTSFFDYENYDLKVVDAIAERWDKAQTLKIISEFKPQFIIGQFGSASFDEDQDFYEALRKQLSGCKILCSGDSLLEEPKYLIENYDWLDAIITDFYKPGPLHYVENSNREIDGLVIKYQINDVDLKEVKYRKTVDISIPKHELFSNHKYRMPFASEYPMATVLTNYACPYPCTFCIMSHLEFKSRTAKSIIEELIKLKEMGIKFIYFSDQTFYTVPKVMNEVLNYMIDLNLGMKWMCFSRVDVMTESKLLKMKKAGCQIIMYGVEWAEDEYLKRYKKQYTVEQIRTAFALTRKVGIKRLGTFLMGVPGQDAKSIRNTVKFAKEIDADYASFNVAVPRANTSFREEAIDRGLIIKEDKVMDQSGSFIAMGTGVLSAKEVMKLKKEAYRKFYFRPGFLLKKLTQQENLTSLKTHFKEGFYIFKSLLN